MKNKSHNRLFKQPTANHSKVTFAFQWLVVAIVVGILLTTVASADVILHAFNWHYKTIKDRADEIVNIGYKMVLVAPPLHTDGDQWWARYQPQDYRVIDGPLGNKEDFKAMIDELSNKGVVVYADIVLNHMANESWKRNDLNYPGSEVLNDYKNFRDYFEKQKLFGNLDDNLFGPNDFHPEKCIMDYKKVDDVQKNRLCSSQGDRGLPDLKPNDWVVEQQKTYLGKVKDLGVKGFRVDAAKHMTNSHINEVFTADIKSGMHIFGEVITWGAKGDDEYEKFLKPYLKDTGHGAYDFPLFHTIKSAFQIKGTMSTFVDPLAFELSLEPSRAITFVITHDIPNNDMFRSNILDPQDEHMAYAYVLGRDGGVPLVYSDKVRKGRDRQIINKREEIL